MSRTQKQYWADAFHTGGWVWIGAPNLSFVPSGANNLVLTKNATGDFSLNRTAAGAETYSVVTDIGELRRLLEKMDFQEQFGGSGAGPFGKVGAPPFTGATQLTPDTAVQSKGLQLIDVVVVYTVGVAALTSAALSLNKTVYANNVANAITNLPIDATALTLTAQANPFLAKRALTTPTTIVDDNSSVNLEFNFVMANTGTIRVYGLGFHVSYNYN